MRVILSVIAALLVISGLATLYLYLKKLFPKGERITFSDWVGIGSLAVNISVLAIAVVSIIIALDSYTDQKISGDEQQKVLVASRVALEKLSATVQQQLVIINEQREQAIEREKRHPVIDIFVNNKPVKLLDLKKGNFITLDTKALQQLTLTIRNNGTSALNKPIIIVSVTPTDVTLTAPDSMVAAKGHNRIQFSGAATVDSLEPNLGYDYGLSLNFPVTVTELAILVTVNGVGFKQSNEAIKIKVSR